MVAYQIVNVPRNWIYSRAQHGHRELCSFIGPGYCASATVPSKADKMENGKEREALLTWGCHRLRDMGTSSMVTYAIDTGRMVKSKKKSSNSLLRSRDGRKTLWIVLPKRYMLWSPNPRDLGLWPYLERVSAAVIKLRWGHTLFVRWWGLIRHDRHPYRKRNWDADVSRGDSLVGDGGRNVQAEASQGPRATPETKKRAWDRFSVNLRRENGSADR